MDSDETAIGVRVIMIIIVMTGALLINLEH